MSAHYQVTFEWGAAGLLAAAADVIVIADADRGPETEQLLRLAPRATPVLEATLENADVVARAALDEQERRGDRVSIAVVAAGERWADGSLRPTATDLLVAGRVVDELASLGIDFHSPACAAACAAAVALRGATRTLVAAEAAALHAEPGTASAPHASATTAGAAR
ncbi:hypothetical protein SAMN04487783_0752 [Agrococcus baldri]|uniref:2-phosphosulfolactate phosphatase n=1 Tax=Agrococcus baldri TaxID=153730 RepID=A0AA94HL21_9MICO|nr:hypothetical protein [Agrococcus baldri]SFS03468.1 hypothetical protein SAMN04487783_0752 [Agrococcus baldri]